MSVSFFLVYKLTIVLFEKSHARDYEEIMQDLRITAVKINIFHHKNCLHGSAFERIQFSVKFFFHEFITIVANIEYVLNGYDPLASCLQSHPFPLRI